MDQEKDPGLNPPASPGGITRRGILKAGVCGLVSLGVGGGAVYYLVKRSGSVTVAEVFKNDAPAGKTWKLWQDRGWVKEARHYLKLDRNVQCKLCPNDCLLEPGDRSRCRNRVNKDGTLYTLVYGNPCAFHVDPIEKKPLFHFIPGMKIFSIATSGCGFRCLNCQNWDISQRKPEESKDPRGEAIRFNPDYRKRLTREAVNRLSMFPDDVVALAEHHGCPSIAYTYSEPTVWYEYMFDTAKQARSRKIKNVWVTCGYIHEKPLQELCTVMDAANVDLKSFDEEIYKKLNSGKLRPILRTLEILKREGVWFEVTNLVVPTYTDRPDMIRRMCDWMVDTLGPDVPIHFSRFHPAHKLTNLAPTPVDTLTEARTLARRSGLRHVYIGNVRDVEGAERTVCHHCGETLVDRITYHVDTVNVVDGKCKFCGTGVAGVW